MGKKFILILLVCALSATILAACGGGSTTNTTNVKGPAVHMNDTDFVQKSITVKKGDSVTLVSDTGSMHIISNGTWENGSPKSASEPGAPQVKDMQISGNSTGTIGPFTTAGTFKFYCTIHQGMNLTVIVQ